MKYGVAIKVTFMVVVSLCVGVFGGIVMSSSLLDRTNRADKLSYTLSFLEERYVDSLSRDSIIELVLPKLLSELDPHSSYMSKEEFARANEPLKGEFDGIGVMFNMMTDTILVTNVIAGGPSAKAGVQPGDMIITVNDSIISGVKMNQEKVMSLLRGSSGSVARIGVRRDGVKDKALTYIDVIRGVIPIKSLDAAIMLDNKTGYIKFSRFASTTYAEVMEAMQMLENKGATNYVLDLRNNTGGYLKQAIYLANEFLPAGKLIVYTKGAHSQRSESAANGSGRFTKVPLVVLIDEGSASASEILAGALQDNDRGTIIGRRSFGKGLVQEQFQFPDNSAARITVARYYTPLGRSIQKPYVAGNSLEYNGEIIRRYTHNELFNKDSIHQNQTERFVTEGGRVLYGGGGIMPDVFVPADTSMVTPYFTEIFTKNLIFKYATLVTKNNRTKINSIKTYDELNRFFAGRNIFDDFVDYASQQGVTVSATSQPAHDKELIMAQIKGYIGRNTSLEDGAYYYYMNHLDDVIIRAKETFLVK